jgi:hypothetical protein
MTNRVENPFRITKSNDLTDEEINRLWVSVTEDDGVTGLARPASPTAMYILGGKGSGKSHLMRYYSFPLQVIRYQENGIKIVEGIKRDGYIGVYARFSGMDSARFGGKAVDEEKWSALFVYYYELWVADKTLATIETLVDQGLIASETDATIAREISGLFDKQVDTLPSVAGARSYLSDLRRSLDYAINNAAFSNQINAEILVTRGKLFFGLPRVFCKHIDFLKDTNFVYLLDELENFAVSRQVYINTLLREREGPTAFRIGSRLYGRRTLKTLGGGERNLRDSEYEELFLDERFRQNSKKYREFALRLISRRLDPLSDRKEPNGSGTHHLYEFFERPSMEWDSSYFLSAVAKHQPAERPHLIQLREKLRAGVSEGLVTGLKGDTSIDELIETVSFPEYPVVEKLCILHLFQKWFRSANIADAARFVRENATGKLSGEKNKKFDEFVDKHKADMIAQWLRENSQKQIYAGLESFIPMSEGLPRALITILKHIYDWATYTGEDPFKSGRISIESQRLGVVEAADLFLEQMLPDGEDGIRVGSAIERLCSLFRANRFADKPIETSLIAFSVDQLALSPEARNLLDLATTTSLIISVERGQRERNSMNVTSKLEINRMLAPRRDLPIARRGVATFDAKMVDLIFVESKRKEFDAFAKSWVEKMTAPAFGRRAERKRRRIAHPDFFE